jgi:hypothetical protein
MVGLRHRSVTRASAVLPKGRRVWNNPWWMDAACKGIDTELFFSSNATPNAQVKMCFDCPVKVTCRLAGYAEYTGDFGNTNPSYREETRMKIFGRVMRKELVADDDLRTFRSRINDLIERGKDVVRGLRDEGLNDAEINLFLADTASDRKAKALFANQQTFTTSNQTYRKARRGDVF